MNGKTDPMEPSVPEMRWDEERRTDVVVLGSGAAGLSAALGALDADASLRVTLVTKTELGRGSTPWAQGGVAIALSADDSPWIHAEDTLRVARELADPAVVRRVTEGGPEAYRRLVEWGARFDRREPTSGSAEEAETLARGREAGHRRHRIVHAGGDATGAELARVLTERVREEAGRPGSRLTIEENLFAAELLLAGEAGSEHVTGVLALRDRRRIALFAPSVVVATGGYGQLYSNTTNPPEVTGDGIAMAARAGARVADLEFVQFHPTTLRIPGDGSPRPLLTEALRGAGAHLVDAEGRRFLFDVHPDGELAPRDVVAATLFERGERGLESFLDLRPLLGDAGGDDGEAAPLVERFPTAWRGCREHGFDPTLEPVPVAPAAHYAMGGLWVDGSGRTSLAGLWACGEAASSGLHGANRLASNSLLEALVLGRRVGGDSTTNGSPGTGSPATGEAVHLPAGAAVARWGRRRSEDVALRREIAELAWSHVGLVRRASGLSWAICELDRLERALPQGPSETRNLLELGRLVAAAALLRDESRGAHRRSDFPATAAIARRTLAGSDELLLEARARLALGETEIGSTAGMLSP